MRSCSSPFVIAPSLALALTLALGAPAVGCSRPAADGAAPAGSSSASLAGSALPGAAGKGTAPLPPASASPKPPLHLLRFSFASEVKAKEPVDRLEAAEPGERVYAHLTLRNRGHEPRSLKLQFRVNGDKRTMLDLKIDPSQSYRTWGFNTLKASDRGELTLQATDDEGNLLVDEKLPIRAPGGATRPPGAKGSGGRSSP